MPTKRRMTKVTVYRNTDRHCFCQMKFQSGERVLVSVANVPEPGVKVIKLLFGVFPKTIWEFSSPGEKDAYDKMIDMFTDQGATRASHPLDAIILTLRHCRSCGEAVRALLQAEERYRSTRQR
jgi:microcystin degradation protein MlrC